jgi:hypothetical protein
MAVTAPRLKTLGLNINDFVTKTLRFRSCAREISADRRGNLSAGPIKRQEVGQIPEFRRRDYQEFAVGVTREKSNARAAATAKMQGAARS